MRVQKAMRVAVGVGQTAQMPYDLVTDANGKFQLTGANGSVVTVITIEKSGYQYTPFVTHAFRYSQTSTAPDPNNPVVFRMWKKQGADRLLHFEKKYGLIPDGRQYTFDFLDRTKADGAQPTGDLIVSITRAAPSEPRKGFDWSFVFDGIGGGVIETTEEYPNLAPESGYQSHYEVHMTPDDNVDVRKQFYVQSRDGKIYSRLHAFINPGQKGEALFSIKCYVNPTGSRNLEYDSRQITSKDDHFPPE